MNIPFPRIKSNIKWCKKWICTSKEYCTWDGLLGFYASGHGDTPQEAYQDWLETYKHDRYLDLLDNGEGEYK